MRGRTIWGCPFILNCCMRNIHIGVGGSVWAACNFCIMACLIADTEENYLGSPHSQVLYMRKLGGDREKSWVCPYLLKFCMFQYYCRHESHKMGLGQKNYVADRNNEE
ncbi:hypothetical protein DPMN_179768 [Dreissena polymorpha]|uniref:Uncharacterized protein n=1 Tax=Dreissena polymorpha TaxID=45954 RepID=A0A9D4EEN9_DREPO|nr:hypothetical protein DPMN_179768 [Dreissena polymorpha]